MENQGMTDNIAKNSISRKKTSLVYETLQIDCIEYLCHVALFQCKPNDAVQLSMIHKDIQQLLYNVCQYKIQIEQHKQHNLLDQQQQQRLRQEQQPEQLPQEQQQQNWLLPTTDENNNTDNDTKLYQCIQITALYFDVINLLKANDASSDVEISATGSIDIIPSSTVFHSFEKQFLVVYELFTSSMAKKIAPQKVIATTAATSTTSNAEEDTWTMGYVQKIHQSILVIFSLVRLREQIIQFTVENSSTGATMANDDTVNAATIKLERIIDEYNFCLRVIFSNNNIRSNTDNDTDDSDIDNETKQQQKSPPHVVTAKQTKLTTIDELMKKIVCAANLLTFTTGVSKGNPVVDTVEKNCQRDGETPLHTTYTKSGTADSPTSKRLEQKRTIPKCLVSFLLNELYHAGRRHSSTTTISTSTPPPPTTTTTTTMQSTSDLCTHIVNHINSILIINKENTFHNTNTKEPHFVDDAVVGIYSIHHLQGMVRTLLRHWGMTKLKRPTLVRLGYDCNNIFSSSTEELRERTMDNSYSARNKDIEERDVTMLNSDASDTMAHARGTTTGITAIKQPSQQSVDDGNSAIEALADSQVSIPSVDLLKMTPQDKVQISAIYSQLLSASNAATEQQNIALEEEGNTGAITPRIEPIHLSRMPPGSVTNDYAMFIAREMAMDEEQEDAHVDRNTVNASKVNSSLAVAVLKIKELLNFSPVRDANIHNDRVVEQVSADDENAIEAAIKSRSPRRTTLWTSEAKRKHQDIIKRRTTRSDVSSQEAVQPTKTKRKHIDIDNEQLQQSSKMKRRLVTEHHSKEETLDFHSEEENKDTSAIKSRSIFQGSEEAHKQRIEAIRHGLKQFSTNTRKWDKIRKSDPCLENFKGKDIHQYYREKVYAIASTTDTASPIRYRIEIDDDNNNHTATSTNSNDSLFDDDDIKQKRRRIPFSLDETQGIIDGINRYGVGRWADIQRNDERLVNRTQVQIKDKYRTMVQQGQMN